MAELQIVHSCIDLIREYFCLSFDRKKCSFSNICSSNISFRKKNTASPQGDCETSCGRCTPDDPDPSNASRPDRGRRKIYFSSTEAGTNIHWLTQQDSREAKKRSKQLLPRILIFCEVHPKNTHGMPESVQPEVQMVWRSIWTQHLWRPKSGWAVRSRPWKTRTPRDFKRYQGILRSES